MRTLRFAKEERKSERERERESARKNSSIVRREYTSRRRAATQNLKSFGFGP